MNEKPAKIEMITLKLLCATHTDAGTLEKKASSLIVKIAGMIAPSISPVFMCGKPRRGRSR